MFAKAWEFIKNIKLDNIFHVDCLKNKASEDFIDKLDKREKAKNGGR